MARHTAKAPRQLELYSHGGKRRGAGRKPSGRRAMVGHDTRARVTRHTPVLVTTKLCAGLPSLRREPTLSVLRATFAAGADRLGFRLVEYSVQFDHLHLLVEAQDERALGRGMKGLLVRVTKALNRTWGRTGRVVGDRYHARALKTPREVRHALLYVLQNGKKHGGQVQEVDVCSSGPWFPGWSDLAPRADRALPRAGSWLLSMGWTKFGLLPTRAAPLSLERRSTAR